MLSLTRWMVPLVLVVGALAVSGQAKAQSQVAVKPADVVMRDGVPYYRHGDFSPEDRLYEVEEPDGRVVYYRATGERRVTSSRSGRAYPAYDYDDAPYSHVVCDSYGYCRTYYYRYRDGYRYRVYEDMGRRYSRGGY